MKKLFITLVFFGLLTACSNEEKSNANDYTVEQAKANGDIVLVYNDDIRNPETYNLDKFAEFQQHVDNQEEATAILTIFDKSGYAKNTFTTKNGEITFDNNYEGFPETIKGELKCKFLTFISGAVNLEMCTGPDGQQLNRYFAFNINPRDAAKYNIHY